MRTVIIKEIIREGIVFTKLNDPHNVKYIQRLQQMMDVNDLSLKQFSDTGLMYSSEDFVRMKPEVRLNKNCTDVMLYVGSNYIQFLSDGTYLLKNNTKDRGNRSKSINKLEQLIYNRLSNEE